MSKKYYVKCAHEGCTSSEINEWTIAGYEPEPIFFFCAEHAAEFGFCIHCGQFIGGTEDIFLTGEPGLCFDCFMQIERELAYDGYDDYEDIEDEE